jgi:hypothetical protein
MKSPRQVAMKMAAKSGDENRNASCDDEWRRMSDVSGERD